MSSRITRSLVPVALVAALAALAALALAAVAAVVVAATISRRLLERFVICRRWVFVGCTGSFTAPTSNSARSPILLRFSRLHPHSTQVCLSPREAEQAVCSICLSAYEPGGMADEKWCALPRCGHIYHAECIAKWFETRQRRSQKAACPLCLGQF